MSFCVYEGWSFFFPSFSFFSKRTLQGNSQKCDGNDFLCEVKLSGFHAQKRKHLRLPVTFSLNHSGLLSISAKVEGTEISKSVDIDIAKV